MAQKWQESFDIEGMTPKEVVEKIAATIIALNYSAIEFAKDRNEKLIKKAYEDGWDDGYEKGHKDGHKEGMTEAVTTITE